jgi:acyl carrier protein
MLEQDLFEFVSARARVEKAALRADTPLFSSGYMDSIAVLEMTAFIEGKSGVSFVVTEIRLDNLDSIGRIMNFVKAKTAR